MVRFDHGFPVVKNAIPKLAIKRLLLFLAINCFLAKISSFYASDLRRTRLSLTLDLLSNFGL